MSTNLQTIARLADEALAELDNDGDLSDESIAEVCGSVVTCITTPLFQLVVEDNGLAFLDYDGDSTEPFAVLHGAIVRAVDNEVRERLEDRLPEDEA